MVKRLILASVAAFLVLAAPATALPPDGAGPNTPGTSGSVSPRTLSPGDTIRFTVSGFPAGEVVHVKIDDGNFCSQKGVHGACVVHQERLGAGGSASGSFVLPADLRPGRHWLRFLASEEMLDAQGRYLGTKGFTTRAGTEFTVVAPRSSTPSTPPADSPDGAPTGPSGSPTDPASDVEVTVLAAGEVLTVPAPQDATAPPTTPEVTASADAAEEEPAVVLEQVADEVVSVASDDSGTAGFPWVGTVGLALLLALGAGLLVRSQRA